MNLEERIILVTDTDVTWNWGDSNPIYYNKTPKSDWGRHVKLDPFPCYSHDKNLISTMVQHVEKKFPIGFNTFYFVYSFEPFERTNGSAGKNTVRYSEGTTKEIWDGAINLYGKRVPIHPAMTRYLVSHEYGHIVDSWICHCKGLADNGIDEEYAKMRGLPLNQQYGGRKWHTNTGEIIANDFRIAVCGIEPEFWPHDCKHPDEDDNVKNWWYEAMLLYTKQI